MRPVVPERGIVTIVYPGRYVEIFREPVTAAEIMRKNPRHCLTRPDVFKFPWIAVKPDSVLPPGKVFWLVPDRTLYDLMNSEDRRCLQQRGNPAVTARNNPPTPSPPKAFAGVTPKHQRHHNPSLVRDETGSSACPREIPVATPYWLDPQNTYEQFRRHLESEGETSDGGSKASTSGCCDNSDDIGPALNTSSKKPEGSRKLRDYLKSGVESTNAGSDLISVWKQGDCDQRTSTSGQQCANVGPAVRTCLKKPGSGRKPTGLRVRFRSP